MAYAARLVAKIQPAASLAGMPRSEPRRASSLRIGTLSGSTTVQQQKFVVKSAISVVEGGDAFVGVKQNTSPIIVIDNYDSFTYNLCQYMGEVGANFEVYRNDEITVEEIKKHASRFRNIIANSYRAWTLHTVVWGLHGLTVHWRGIWREGCPISLWSCAWKRLPCSL